MPEIYTTDDLAFFSLISAHAEAPKNIHSNLVTSDLAMHRQFIPSLSQQWQCIDLERSEKFGLAGGLNFFVQRILTSKSFRPPDLEGISC